MAIDLVTPIAREAINFKFILLSGLRIKQAASQDSSIPPVYTVDVNYKLYAIDSGGQRRFKPDSYSITIPDYLAAGEAQALLGDNRMLAAISAIEQALAKHISEQGTLGNAVVAP